MENDSLDWKNEILHNRYIILKKLGEGAYASVWLSFDIIDKKYYAIKICNGSDHEIKVANKEEEIYNIIKKYKCDNVMTVNNVFNKKMCQTNHKCFVLELMAGCLFSLIGSNRYKKGLPIKTVLSVMKQILTILTKLHDDNIIHGDVKPENILINGLSIKQRKLISAINIDKLIGNNEIVQQIKKKNKTNKSTIMVTDLLKKIKEITDGYSDNEIDSTNSISKNSDADSNNNSNENSNDNSSENNDEEESNGEEDDEDDEDDVGIMSLSSCDTNDTNDTESILCSYDYSYDSDDDLNLENNNVDHFSDDVIILENDNIHVKLSDMGGCITPDMKKHYHTQTEYYRSPELLLELEYGTSSDMWALGCTMLELLTGKILFDAKSSGASNKKRHHIYLITKKIGMIEKTMCEQSPKKDIFFSGDLTRIKGYKSINFSDPLLSTIEIISKKNNLSCEIETHLKDFVIGLFKLDPTTRITAKDALNHPIFDPVITCL